MLNAIETVFRKWRRRVSRSEWLIRLLRLSKTQGTACEPGLVLVQIDGLSRRQMERAMAKGRLPFLSQLLRRHKYRLHSLYSGLPSSTSAMTAELLYGVRCAVPAFSFYDRSRETVVRMFESQAANDTEERLQRQGRPLLAGGSVYAGIYTGGAAETHFCASTMGFSDLFRAKYPLRLFILLLFSVFSVIRVGTLLVIEFILAFVDVVRGLIAGQDLWKELKFVPSRVGVSILMRELATIGAMIDTARGVPVIYLDLVGYDEQSHRRGPTSRFAHWTLKGIDNAIGRIWRTARRSSLRDYDVRVFSDHGSEEATPYPVKYGRTLREALAEVLEGVSEFTAGEHDVSGIQTRRMGSYMPRRVRPEPAQSGDQQPKTSGGPGKPVIVAMGPVGHVYVDHPLEDSLRARLAQALVERAHIPMVAIPETPDRARVWTSEGQFTLPADASRVFAPGHPFLDELATDFVALCNHLNAGDFVLWGWSRSAPYVTFPVENGSHAGPGLEETHAFALLPDDAPLRLGEKGYMRPGDLRAAALDHIERRSRSWTALGPPVVAREPSFRVMTYNVHSCVGIDGQLSPRRVARVISRFAPDVVALQEVDVGRMRTGQTDQARLIAEYLEMDYHFHPTIEIAEEAYGDCVLSRLPMELVKAEKLPSLRGDGGREPRGALWVRVQWAGGRINLVNTHLGLNSRERLRQIHALLGEEWLGNLGHSEPIILCGDFNASPRSHVCALCLTRFRDVQLDLSGHNPCGTWFGHYPIARIDHVFVDPCIRVVRVEVGSDYLSRIASDHRPLLVELSL